MATAAYEHDEIAAPNRPAVAIERGPPSGNNFDIASFAISTSMIAERAKPRLRPQKICQNMVKASHNA